MRKAEIVGVPPVLPFESMASWISRLALSQGTQLGSLGRHFHMNFRGDIDLRPINTKFKAMFIACGIVPDAFGIPFRLFGNLRQIMPRGGSFVACVGGLPRYRFCPLCLREQTTPYFPVHWRFVCWRWCPLHCCLMEDRCPHCASPLTLPVDMLKAGPQREGVGYLSHCPRCASQLSRIAPARTGKSAPIADWDRMVLKNGRASLAALYAGHLRFEGSDQLHPLRALRDIERRGLLTHRFEWLSASSVRARVAQRKLARLKLGDSSARGQFAPR